MKYDKNGVGYRKRRRKRRRLLLLLLLLFLMIFAGCSAVVLSMMLHGNLSFENGFSFQEFSGQLTNYFAEQDLSTQLKKNTNDLLNRDIFEIETETETQTEAPTEPQTEAKPVAKSVAQDVLDAAALQAAMYDYDAAIDLLQKAEFYSEDAQAQALAADYQKQKDSCVAIDPENVTHIFYHSLVVDPARAFDPNKEGYDGWQQWMTTIYEFDQITQSMYDKGYVLVSLHDLIKKTENADGSVHIEKNQIYLPEGKKAFVLSIDDLSYYHTYEGRGVAEKIVLDEEGKPTCEYIRADGTVEYGDFDVVPRMDSFLEAHPDGCYRGARGTIALTGYNGILGYRTDGTYDAAHNTNTDVYYADNLQIDWLNAHPDFNWEKECEQAKEVVNAMKAEGWTFASHTWGHKAVGSASYEDLVRDTERWLEYVSPLLGGTDTIIFAHGEDITGTSGYSSDNAKYTYLKSKGFDIYCPVDSVDYTVNITEDYLHQGRRNLDGYRIYHDMISDSPMAGDLFDAKSVIDPDRPLPVPDLGN
ncbi:MAG: polysaccharide deacetylase [Eubacteriales bacterium]|nr:polysaccharide deacetylase [Eubacteriales bacterium]